MFTIRIHALAGNVKFYPFSFIEKKPFVNVEVQLDTLLPKRTSIQIVINSVESDVIWLFENSKSEIKSPKRFFNDILGKGLSGSILGKRSSIPKLKTGRFEIKKPTVSFSKSVFFSTKPLIL